MNTTPIFFALVEQDFGPNYFSGQKNKATTEVVTLFWRAGRDSKGFALRARKLADPIMFGFAECGSNPQQLSHKKQKRQPI